MLKDKAAILTKFITRTLIKPSNEVWINFKTCLYIFVYSFKEKSLSSQIIEEVNAVKVQFTL